MHDPPLILDLVGPVRLHCRDGGDLTPRLMRSRAVLALLGATEGHRRSRAWIQDRLWSDRPGPDGAAALRYTLWDVRRALGVHRAALLARDGWIALDPARIEVRQAATGPDGPVFAEGLDIDDPEFDAWLRARRAAADVRAVAPFLDGGTRRALQSLVHIDPDGGDDDQLCALARTLATRIAARLSRATGAVVRIGPRPEDGPTREGIELRADLRLSRVRGRILAQVSVADVRRGEVVWTNDRDLPRGLSGQDPLNPFANLTAEGIGRALARPPPDATDAERAAAAYCRALSMPRSFGASDLAASIAALGTAASGEIEELAAPAAARRALYLGWLVIERHAPCAHAALEEARTLARQAIELDPGLSEAFAVRAELADFDRRRDLAHDLARHAVDLDPFNPLSVAALAKAEARTGRGDEAYRRAQFARQLAVGSAIPAWWATLCCTTALGRGDAATALRHAETAHELAPAFLPPLRLISALRFMTGDVEGAGRALAALARSEPGFSPDRLTDPDYPLRSIDTAVLRNMQRAGIG